ncbi:hypothetical protein BJF91_07975 [Allorhizobium taibaishanense]|uniref:YhdP central domain-containing protein n=1 Tax=Allorhizobium taibaishanense TaxID=887144 RepID=A0A1Q9A0R6_9HYPH|nr:hypothetical protein BJF91_07975 [Allorhizobium taibaishanense]
MGEIRGEKIRFRKSDIVSLETLPSSQAEDPLIVHCPRRRGFVTRILRFFAYLLLSLMAMLGAAAIAIETGTVDQALSTGARAAFQSAIGDDLKADIDKTSIRLSQNLHLAVAAENVTLTDPKTGQVVSKAGDVKLVIDPLSLIMGKVSVTEIDVTGIDFDTSRVLAGGDTDLSTLRIDRFPPFMETLFSNLDDVRGFIVRGGLDRLRLGGITIPAKDGIGKPVDVQVEDLIMTRRKDGSLAIQGTTSINGKVSTIAAEASANGTRTTSLTATVTDLIATPFLIKRTPTGVWRDGADTAINIDFYAVRQSETQKPALSARLRTENGLLYIDGDQQELTRADINLAYDFDKLTAEIRPSELDFGPTHIPLTGGFVDLDRLQSATPGAQGIGIDLLIDRGTASVEAAGEEAFPFSVKAFGEFIPSKRHLGVRELTVSTPHGTMQSTVDVQFGDASPEIRFSGKLFEMRTAMVKQLWPYWMASKPRAWVLANLFGGTLSNASIDVLIPAGRMKAIPQPLNLNADELKIAFDISGARMNVTGDLPPIRDLNGHFDLSGQDMEVRIDGGTSYFPSGRKVRVEKGSFGVANTYAKPLMANIAVTVSGAADAMAELATFKPMQALQRTEFVPEDFSGQIKADVQLYGGIIADQKPPPEVWKASLDLSGVALKRPYLDRKITDFDGTLTVDPMNAILHGNGEIDGVPAQIDLTQPVERNTTRPPSWTVKAQLNDSQRAKMVPGLGDIVTGTIDLEISRLDENRQSVKSDLSRATLTLPVIGWSKGAGIPAKVSMELQDKNGVSSLDKFVLDGDGFGASGKLVVSKANGLVEADLDHMKLAAADDFGLSVQVNKGVINAKIRGSSLDGRAFLKKLKGGGAGSAGSGGAEGKSSSTDVDINIDVDKLVGFNDEALSGVKLLYGSRAGAITALKLSALTDTGQAVVVQSSKASYGNDVSLISSDAGTLARFVDLYSHMRGGMLDVKIRGDIGKNWMGNVDLRNFRVENEDRLQKIVTTPATDDGRSLNTAVKRDLDVSSEKFQRAFARLIYQDGVLRTDNGIVRGEQVGASFQGLIKDARGQMEMTGTFMPAYGLNRLFAEVPIIGSILGNGRDRGLLGITFKLKGPVDAPHLIVNPLSIIAPGMFRQIFEFQ